MPKPCLRGWLRYYGSICLLVGSSTQVISADNLLTDQTVPPQFQQAKVDEVDDTLGLQGLTILQAGNSSGSTRKHALAEVPLDQLRPADRAKTAAILKSTSLYRRLPKISFEADAQVYHYLLQHPDVAVSTWKVMGISKFALQNQQPGVYAADAGDGSRGTITVMLSTPTETIICCEGAFKSPILPKPILANSIMRLQVKFEKQPDGRVFAVHTGDVFVDLPSQTVETVARLISPISHVIADRNFKQLTFYVHMMSTAMTQQPGWIEHLASRMEQITEEQRTEFLKLSATTYLAHHQRGKGPQGQAVSLDEVLLPLRLSESTPPGTAPQSGSKSPARVTIQPASNTTRR